MKTFNVALNANFRKEIKVKANNRDEALDFVQDIFFDTDLISFVESDIVSIESDCDEYTDDEDDTESDSDEEHLYDELY